MRAAQAHCGVACPTSWEAIARASYCAEADDNAPDVILFRRKYPRWWFDWNLELTRFAMRVYAYLVLLRDEYPSSDEPQGVHLDVDYPDAARDLSRWLPLVKPCR